VLIAVGGTPGSEHFASAASPANRAVFVRNLVALVNARGYDGIDLDWETGVNHGDYVALVKDLRAALGTKLLSAVYLGSWSALARDTHAYLDWVSMMTYLPYGQPSNAHNSAIYGSLYARIDNLVNLWTGSGVPVAKILPGLATYASVWSGGSLVTAEMPYATAKARGYTAGQAWDATALTSYGRHLGLDRERPVRQGQGRLHPREGRRRPRGLGAGRRTRRLLDPADDVGRHASPRDAVGGGPAGRHARREPDQGRRQGQGHGRPLHEQHGHRQLGRVRVRVRALLVRHAVGAGSGPGQDLSGGAGGPLTAPSRAST
jgi:hypothetical protein